MDRRDFIKLTAVTGAGATLASCGNPEHQLIRFVPDDDITPATPLSRNSATRSPRATPRSVSRRARRSTRTVSSA